MTILLALDASTTAVGWCLMEDGTYRDSGVYVPKGPDWVDRISAISTWLHDMDYDYMLADQHTLAIEIATGDRGNMRTNRLLGAVEYVLRGYARDWLYDRFVEVTASQVRASGCHKLALRIAEAIVHEYRPDRTLTQGHEGDEADAIGVALAAWAKMREVTP